ncbi:MAG TPA: serine hydrolase domain-containing protein [Burkholderiaceae bacterium]|nr:serine hydrolase domain-containing protein [Burkholderiaceae bacterium]
MNALADQVLRRGVGSSDVPGVVAAATNRHGLIYEGAYGKRAVGEPDDMTVDTVAWIASMTKPLTTTAAMQLVEQGRLDLDKPVSQWVPGLRSPQVLEGFDSDGKPRTRRATKAITLRHLLTHTSGFAYTMWSEDLLKYQQAAELPGITSCLDAALDLPLLYEPGERWEYGIGIDWVGKIVETVSGKKLGAYVHEHVLVPLGMNDTAFRISPAMRGRLAKVHQRGDDGGLAATQFEIPQEPEFEMGGGGLYSTAPDYLKFIRMILNRGQGEFGRVLRPETVDLMSRSHLGDLTVRKLRTAVPPVTNDAEFFPGMRKTWGLGFMINTEVAPTGRSAGSLAWAGLANTYFWIDPARGVGGVYLTQLFPFADHKSTPLFLEFEKAIYQSIAA